MLKDRADGLFRISVFAKYLCVAGFYLACAVIVGAGLGADGAVLNSLLGATAAIFVTLLAFGASSQSWSMAYSRHPRRTTLRYAVREAAICLGPLLSFWALPALPHHSPMFVTLVTGGIFSLGLLTNRYLPALISRLLYRKETCSIAVVIGNVSEVIALQQWLETTVGLGLEVVGFLTLDDEEQPLARVSWPALGTVDQLLTMIREKQVQQVIYACAEGHRRASEVQADIERMCDEYGVRLAIYCRQTASPHRPYPATSVYDGSTLLAAGEPLQNPVNAAMKRGLDIVLSLPVVVVVLPPLSVAVRLAQRLQSKGPLLFCQERCGQSGEPFTVYKFRTMNQPEQGRTDLEDNPEARIYPMGEFLRVSRLDEMPQFINVLLGSMSIVGPRPHHIQDRQKFSRIVRHYPLRLIAKPGITGLAQYKEYCGVIRRDCVESRVRKDLDYINHWSFMADLTLILKTGRVIVEGIGRALTRREARRIAPAVNEPTHLPIHTGLRLYPPSVVPLQSEDPVDPDTHSYPQPAVRAA